MPRTFVPWTGFAVLLVPAAAMSLDLVPAQSFKVELPSAIPDLRALRVTATTPTGASVDIQLPVGIDTAGNLVGIGKSSVNGIQVTVTGKVKVKDGQASYTLKLESLETKSKSVTGKLSGVFPRDSLEDAQAAIQLTLLEPGSRPLKLKYTGYPVTIEGGYTTSVLEFSNVLVDSRGKFSGDVRVNCQRSGADPVELAIEKGLLGTKGLAFSAAAKPVKLGFEGNAGAAGYSGSLTYTCGPEKKVMQEITIPYSIDDVTFSATVTGSVLFDDGSPAHGATVTALDGSSVTDGRGAFSLVVPLAVPEVSDVVVEAVLGSHRASQRIERLAAGEIRSLKEPLVFHREPAGTRILGQVRLADGSPAAGATVAASTQDTTGTDAQGRFELPLTVRGDLLTDVRITASLGDLRSTIHFLEIRRDQTIELARPLFLVPAPPVGQATVMGQVLDDKNQPVPGARVSSSLGRSTESGADGRYQLTGIVQPGCSLSVHVSATMSTRGLFCQGKTTVAELCEREALGGNDVVLTCIDDVEVASGFVVDPAGKPVAGARVYSHFGAETLTFDDGAFALLLTLPGGVHPTAHEIQVVARRGDDILTATEIITEVSRGEDVDLGTLQVKPLADLTAFPGPRYPARAAPAAVWPLDQEADGILDLFVALEAGGGFLLMGDGQGRFYHRSTPVSGRVISPRDLNGDRFADLITLGASASNVVVYHGTASGTFRGVQSLGSGGFNALDAAVADVNLDGQLDLMLGFSRELHLYRGAANGTFDEESLSAPLPDSWSNLGVVDVEGDGNPDVVVGGRSMAVLWGHGDGTFEDSTALTISAPVGTVAVADLDGDGDRDLQGPRGDGKLSRFTNFGGRQFTTEQVHDPGVAALSGGDRIGLYQVDGSEGLDIIVLDSRTDEVVIYPHLGGDAFQTPPRRIPVGLQPRAVAFADFDGDGNQELLAANAGSRDISVLAGLPGGDYSTADTLLVFSKAQALATRLADLDRDGDQDALVAVAAGEGQGIIVLPGQADGQLGTVPTAVLDLTPAAVIDYAVGHCNEARDSFLDVFLLATGSPASLVVYAGQGDGTFGEGRTFGLPSRPSALALGDVDKDGHVDVVLPEGDNVEVRFGDGTGSFAASTIISLAPVGSPIVHDARRAAVEDMDGDGLLDIVVLNVRSSSVGLLKNLGNRAFARPTNMFPVAPPAALEVYDVNLDGRMDILTLSLAQKAISVLINLGSGAFGSEVKTELPEGGQVTALTRGDVDGDGTDDLVYTTSTAHEVRVLSGSGEASFALKRTFGALPDPVDVSLSDLDRDGRLDVVVTHQRNANGNPAKVAVLRNSSGQ